MVYKHTILITSRLTRFRNVKLTYFYGLGIQTSFLNDIIIYLIFVLYDLYLAVYMFGFVSCLH